MPPSADAIGMQWRPERTAPFAIAIAAMAGIALAVARTAANLSLHVPLQRVTSGAEQEALFSIWRQMHGRPVFTDPRFLPYAASYFNWFFYALYGFVAKGCQSWFHLGDGWLPTVCRFVTLTLACCGAAILGGILRSEHSPRHRARRIAFASLAFFNPLCGFWLITARPDLGAAVLELAGMALFFRHLESGRAGWIMGAGLAFAAAWGFKQTSLVGAGTVTFILLCHVARRPSTSPFRAFSLFTAIGLGAVATTLVLLGPVYRHGLWSSQLNSGFSLFWALHHLALAMIKMPFIPVASIDAALTFRRECDDPRLRATGLLLLGSFALEFLLACKGGAGDYYFVPLGVWSVLWLGLRRPERLTGWHAPALAVASLLLVADVGAIFLGRGFIDAGAGQPDYTALTHRLASQPGPVLVEDTYGDLPWISPPAPHFVIASNNEVDFRAGTTFEHGGWQGLLAQGYFALVVTRAGSNLTAAPPPDRYRLSAEANGWRYFARK